MPHEIIIDPEFRALKPPLAPQELAVLEASITRHGCLHSLKVWNGVLLDGHQRYEICTRLGLSYNVVSVELPDREAAADWIEAEQLGQRNLTADASRLLLGRIYNRAKKRDGERGRRK